MRSPILSISALLLLCSGLFAQVAPQRRAGPPIVRGPAPLPSVKVVPINDPVNDFVKKGLPNAYIFGGDPNPALAKKAAAMVLKNDQDSLSALIGALLTAGFHISTKSRKYSLSQRIQTG